MSTEIEPEDDMMSEEEQEEADREFLTPIFFLSMAHINGFGKTNPGVYDVYLEGYFGQAQIERILQRFKITIIESYSHGLHIGLKRCLSKKE
jgi:hypothetical protein